MFGMLESLTKRLEDKDNRKKYVKEYPFNTSKDGNTGNDGIMVYDVDFGYCVFEFAPKIEMIKWCDELDEAIEFAVDHARERILNYQS